MIFRKTLFLSDVILSVGVNDIETFEHIIFRSFGIDEHFEEIRQSLISMQKARGSVRD